MTKANNAYAVIMAGGIGERFWPLSRRSNPKQFLDVFTGEPMLLTTVKRMLPSIPASRMILVTNAAYAEKSRRLLKRQKGMTVIGEPVGRNTAPAIAAAAAVIERKNPDGVMVVLSADHIITPVEEFLGSIDLAVRLSLQGETLVCLGVRPLYPHTGLGHIEIGEALESSGNTKAFRVRRFVEKPDLERAREFTASGNYLWNCGIFVWSVRAILNAFEKRMPDLFAQLSPVRTASGMALKKALDRFYKNVTKESIDYGVLEKSENIAVVESPIRWSDVGSWSAFKELSPTDEQGNVFKGECVDLESRDCFVLSDKGLVATYGLSGVYAIKHKDSLLLIHKDKVADIKKLIEKIRGNKSLAKHLD
jgi:mannose-1-phosphate guanylyltransferase